MLLVPILLQHAQLVQEDTLEMEQLHALNALLEMHQHQFYVNNVFLTAQLAATQHPNAQLVLPDISLMVMALAQNV